MVLVRPTDDDLELSSDNIPGTRIITLQFYYNLSSHSDEQCAQRTNKAVLSSGWTWRYKAKGEEAFIPSCQRGQEWEGKPAAPEVGWVAGKLWTAAREGRRLYPSDRASQLASGHAAGE